MKQEPIFPENEKETEGGNFISEFINSFKTIVNNKLIISLSIGVLTTSTILSYIRYQERQEEKIKETIIFYTELESAMITHRINNIVKLNGLIDPKIEWDKQR